MTPLAQAADFRLYVWYAYGAVLLFLALFSLWSSVQVRSAEKKLDDLLDRLHRSGK